MSINALETTLDKRSCDIINEIASGHSKLVDLLSGESLACRDTLEKEFQATRNQLRAIHADIVDAVVNDGQSTRIQVDKLSAQLGNLNINNQRLDMLNTFMKKLEFPEMFDRRESIEPAHEGTCRYISEIASFRNWLEGDDELVYWIQGKAGSGKSTLMSFLIETSENENGLIKTGLHKWTSGTPVDLLSFYFWESGTLLQRNTEGLLRSLLWQLLNLLKASSDHSVYRTPSFKAFSDVLNHTALPGVRRLMELFSMTIEERRMPFCIMIDGLDEFGDDLDVLELVESLRVLGNVKLCVSSRPSEIFKDYFEGFPQFTLQELTASAIKTYVTDKFQMNQTVKRLTHQNPGAVERLIDDIIYKADGVFLWVKLVVKDLLKGLKLRDSSATLAKRLERLSNELFDLYEHMWRRNQDFELYKEEAAMYFGLVDHAREADCRITLLDFGLAVDQDLRSRCLDAIDDLDSPWFGFELDDEHLRTRISVCAAGLIEARHRMPESEHSGNSNDPDIPDDPVAQVIVRANSLWVEPIHKSVLEFYHRASLLQELANLRMSSEEYVQCLTEVSLLSNGLSILTQREDCDDLKCSLIRDDDSSIVWFEKIERMVHRISRETTFRGRGFKSYDSLNKSTLGYFCREPQCRAVDICVGGHTVFDAAPWVSLQFHSLAPIPVHLSILPLSLLSSLFAQNP